MTTLAQTLRASNARHVARNPGPVIRGRAMISCIFAYAKGAESQSTAVELSDPMSALFMVKNDDRARNALSDWIAQGYGYTPRRNEAPNRAPPAMTRMPRAA